jgi:cyclophilin family peptidyl-prolyl cis-trans isomerase
MKNTQKTFKALKNNHIATKPLGLGAMPETIIYTVKNNKHIDTISFTTEPLVGVKTDAKRGKVYNHYHNKTLKRAKAIHINKILARNDNSDFLIIKGFGICLDDFISANTDIATEKVQVFPSKIFFVGDDSKTDVPLLIKEYHFEDEIFSEVVTLRKAIHGGKRDAEEGEIDDYMRFRDGTISVYTDKINEGKILIWENTNNKNENQSAQKVALKDKLQDFKFPKFQILDWVEILDKYENVICESAMIEDIFYNKNGEYEYYAVGFDENRVTFYEEGEVEGKEEGYYGDGLTFHRVTEDFISSGGNRSREYEEWSCVEKFPNYQYYVVFEGKEPPFGDKVGTIPKVYEIDYARNKKGKIIGIDNVPKNQVSLKRAFLNHQGRISSDSQVYFEVTTAQYPNIKVIPNSLAKIILTGEYLHTEFNKRLKEILK